MKKITLTFTLLSMLCALMFLGPRVQAATIWNTDYIFDQQEISLYGVTVTVEEGTNVFTWNGTYTDSSSNTKELPNMFAPNTNGSSLSPTKKYAFYYEYISGTMTGNMTVIESADSNAGVRSIKRSATGSSAYTINSGYLQMYTQEGYHRIYATINSVFTNLKYKLHIIEIENPYQDDGAFFTDLTNAGSTITGTLVDAYTVKLNGTHSSTSSVVLTSKLNPYLTNPDHPVLITYHFVSGTKTGTATLTPGALDIESQTGGIILDEVTNVTLLTGSSGSYTDYTFKLHYQDIELYSESVPGPWTVSFNSFGGSSVASQEIADGGLVTEPEDPTKSGYTFSHWVNSETNGLFNFLTTPVTSDLVLRAVYQPLPGTQWTVSFQTNGGTSIQSQTVLNDNLASVPPNPTRPGHDFIEWRVVGTGLVYNFNAPVTEDITLSAVWESNMKVVYTISFITNSNTVIDDILLENGDTPLAPEDPMRSGYTFVKWVITGTETEFIFGVPFIAGEDVEFTLTALWEESPVTFAQITFNSNGGTAVPTQTVYEGDLPVEPTAPTRSGYTFAGWYKNVALTQTFSFVGDLVSEDITLYAKWVPVSGGGEPITDEPSESGSVWLYVGLGAAALALLAGSNLKSKKKGHKR